MSLRKYRRSIVKRQAQDKADQAKLPCPGKFAKFVFAMDWKERKSEREGTDDDVQR